MPKTNRSPGTVTHRITAEGSWRSLTALHTGGDAQFDSHVDLPLARDHEGAYYLPGTSLAGAVRSHLARQSASSFQQFCSGFEAEDLETLFGAKIASGQATYASLLLWSDATLLAAPPVAVRDGVRIVSSSGQAAPKGKYNVQVLPAGATFRLRLELVLYHELPAPLSHAVARQLLRDVLSAFSADGLRLGARTRKGLGRGQVDQWTIREFDLTSPSGALDWLAGQGYSGGQLLTLDDLGAPSTSAAPPERFSILASFQLRSSLLIRAGSPHLNGPDVSHFQENELPWIPGTSLVGVFRHRVERVARTLGDDGAAVGRRLFGIANEKDEQGNWRPEAASRVWVEEIALPGQPHPTVQSRVALDRFTGGALEARLFDSSPYWAPGATFSVSIQADNPSPTERLYLLAAFKDLWLGDLPVGGESGVGRGVLFGLEAKINESARNLPTLVWTRDPSPPYATRLTNLQRWQPLLAEVAP